MTGSLDSILTGKPPELAPIAQQLCDTVTDSGLGLESAVRWSALTYALRGDFHHWICSVSVTKSCANLTFHFGSILDDPTSRFVANKSKLMRRLEYRDLTEIDADEVRGFLTQAVEKYPWFRQHWRELT